MFVFQHTCTVYTHDNPPLFTIHSQCILYTGYTELCQKKDETKQVDFQAIDIKNHLIVVMVKDVKCV